MSEDTTSVYIHGNKVVIYNFYRVLPGTVSRGFGQFIVIPLCIYYQMECCKKLYVEGNSSEKLYDRTVVEKIRLTTICLNIKVMSNKL